MSDAASSTEESRRRILFIAAGVVVTAVLVAVALGLGGWAYSFRKLSLHDGRLRRLVELRPEFDVAREGLLSEPEVSELRAPMTEADLRRVAEPFPIAQSSLAVSKRRQWAAVRAFAVQDMVYVLYLDVTGHVRDYVLLHP